MSCCIMSPIASSAVSVNLCHHSSFHGVFVLSSHHMTVPSQSGLSYFVSNACHPQRLSDDIIPFHRNCPPLIALIYILLLIDLTCPFLHSLMSLQPLTWFIMSSSCNVFMCPSALTAHLLTGSNPTWLIALKCLSRVTLELHGFGLSWASLRGRS